jgi:hypothetical protein
LVLFLEGIFGVFLPYHHQDAMVVASGISTARSLAMRLRGGSVGENNNNPHARLQCQLPTPDFILVSQELL